MNNHFNSDHYPTPKNIIDLMHDKVDNHIVKKVLEPHGGQGHIIEAWPEYRLIHPKLRSEDCSYKPSISIDTIEIDPALAAMLRGKGFNVIDSDFLQWPGVELYDLIVMNPPFSNGDAHWHHALDVMFNGQIVGLINAETLRNPYSNSRQRLVQRLEELNADIEYIPNAFSDSERKTDVEIAYYICTYKT